MFLDEKLYNKVKSFEIQKPSDFQLLINELYKICEDHFKPKLRPDMSYKEGKIMMDQVFNAWDLFIKKLQKEQWFLIDILKEYPYKSAFMNNEKLKEIYFKGK